MSAIAGKAAKVVLGKKAKKYEPADPHYVTEVNAQGKSKVTKKVRPTPPGLSKRDEKILKKIRKRAHYLDKGMNLCGLRVGWTFPIGFIPVLGDLVNAMLNYNLVVKPSKRLDIPDWLVSKMYLNNAVSAGVGFVPIAGDVVMAIWKANSRNAHLLEEFLTIRGAEFLAQNGNGQSFVAGAAASGPAPPARTAGGAGRQSATAPHVVHGQSVPSYEVQEQFGAGGGMTPAELAGQNQRGQGQYVQAGRR